MFGARTMPGAIGPLSFRPIKELTLVKRQPCFWLGTACLASALSLPACDYGAGNTDLPLSGISSGEIGEKLRDTNSTSTDTTSGANPGNNSEFARSILDGVIKQIENAPTNPEADTFEAAINNLNQYFKKYTDPKGFAISPEAREFLQDQKQELMVTESVLQDLESPKFVKRDGRHIEDCLLYHMVATRAAKQGDDLSRVRAVFGWVVQQIQLVPPGSLAPPGLPQAQARPFDVLLRGMATEQGGEWAERAWLFMALCRQLGIDVGLLKYKSAQKPEETYAWICAVAIGNQAYLFDARIGMPIPGPDGTGVATLEEAATNPLVLRQLDLPGQAPYKTTLDDLNADKLVVLIDSSLGYFAPRMRLFQENLTGKYRMILFREPMAQRDKFAEAMGERFGGVELWSLPRAVEYNLFHDAGFVTATQWPIQIFDARLPLLTARLDELRGEIDQAKEKYGKFRFAPDLVMADKKTRILPAARQALDMYATYFLALCQLDQNHPDQAEFLLKQTLDHLPEPQPNGPFCFMYRWGAQANLARLYDAKGDERRAIAYYCQPDPTWQSHGNLLRARDLVWRDPTAPLPEPLPPAPALRLPPSPAVGPAPPEN